MTAESRERVNSFLDKDFSSGPVPQSERVGPVSVLFVWLGFLIVAGIMAVGGGLASQLSAPDLIFSLVVGNALLAVFSGLAGSAGARSGLSFNQLMAQAFCGHSWRLVSLYVPVVLMGWYGVEAAIFGGFVARLAGWGDIGARATMAASAAAFATSAYFGFRGIRTVSFLLVPIIMILGAVALRLAPHAGEWEFGFGETHIDVDTGIALVVGTWVMGALTCVPDLTRFCRSSLQGAAVASIGVVLGVSFTLGLGALGAVITQESDPAAILLGLGFPVLGLVLSFSNIWTTNDNNMYSASLNVSRMVGIPRRQAVLACTVLGTAFAALNPATLGFVFPFLFFLGATAPALGGVVLTRYYAHHFGWINKDSEVGSWLAWAMGAALSYSLQGAWAAPAGFAVGGVVWLLASGTLGRRKQREPGSSGASGAAAGA